MFFFLISPTQKSKKPTILICTSGSALLNYYPAVAEAYYSEIPLIILSADRPEYKINIKWKDPFKPSRLNTLIVNVMVTITKY